MDSCKTSSRATRSKFLRSLWASFVFLACCVTSLAVHAQGTLDSIRLRNSVESGKVTRTSALAIEVSKGGVEKTVPAEEIVGIIFSTEPQELNSARIAAEGGRSQEALKLLEEINKESLRRDEIRSDVEYFTALAIAKLALAGSGDVDQAIDQVKKFLTSNRTSFRTPAAIELLGDLFVAAGQFEDARNQYQTLGKAKSPYYKLRSELLTGRAWQAEQQDAKALEAFRAVLASPETGPTIEPIKLGATLDLAVSQAAAGEATEAIQSLDDIIAKADPEIDADLLAQAYNALGAAQRKAGDPQAALFAFLHVDLLYPQTGQSHARALYELTSLWKELGHADRAQQAAEKLAKRYPESRWASR